MLERVKGRSDLPGSEMGWRSFQEGGLLGAPGQKAQNGEAPGQVEL